MRHKLPTGYSPSYQGSKTASVSSLSGGLVLTDEPYTVGYGRALEAKNVWFDNNGLCKRFGQRTIDNTSADILSLSHTPYQNHLIYHSGNELKAYDLDTKKERTIYPTGDFPPLTSEGGEFIEFGDFLYYKNGHEFISIDANLYATPVTGSAPTTYVNCNPTTGEGDKFQSPNRLGGRFIIRFTSDIETNIYKSPVKGFDITNIKVRLGGTELTVSAANAAAGTITLAEPVIAGVNDLEIELQKRDIASEAQIMKCTYIARYGSDNEVRLICAGNPDEKNKYYSSGTLDASYWPEESYNLAGSSDEAITGFGKYYGELILFKEHSIWSVSYDLTDALVSFPSRPINQMIGCDCPKTIQCIDNTLVWLSSTYGVCGLFSTVLQNEKNVRVLSQNINGTPVHTGLLSEYDLHLASSLDWNGRYFLFLNGRAYVLDYKVSAVTNSPENLSWWYFDNISLFDYAMHGNTLYYVGKDEHVLCTPTSDFRDFGKGFSSYWRSAPMSLGTSARLKTFFDLFLTMSASKQTYAKLSYQTDSRVRHDPTPVKCLAFSLAAFSLDTFSLFAVNHAKTFRRRIGLSGAQFISFIIENDIPGSDIGILSFEFTFKTDREMI